MSEVFISYDAEDRDTAQRIAAAVERRGRSVFYDRRIPAGSEWADMLLGELESTNCMIVLWSKNSINSFWVRSEAAEGLERGILIPVCIDEVTPPRLFRHIQTVFLEDCQDDTTPAFESLLDQVVEQLGGPAFRGLHNVPSSGVVSEENLTLIHSSWRRKDKDTEFPGRHIYQIHVIVHGSRDVLQRIESVTYLLSGYPPKHREQKRTDRDRNFELKELAWGPSLLRADALINDQPEIPEARNPVRLYRYINLTETGPRLDLYFKQP